MTPSVAALVDTNPSDPSVDWYTWTSKAFRAFYVFYVLKSSVVLRHFERCACKLGVSNMSTNILTFVLTLTVDKLKHVWFLLCVVYSI